MKRSLNVTTDRLVRSLALGATLALVLGLGLAGVSCSKKGTNARPSSTGSGGNAGETSLHGQFTLPVSQQARWEYATLPTPEPSRKPAYLLRSITFALGSSQLDREGRGVLGDLAQMLKDRPKVRVLVIGFADKAREATNAQNLGLMRAHAARDALAAAGISKARFEVASFGSSQAQAGADSPIAQEQDRRAEVWLLEE